MGHSTLAGGLAIRAVPQPGKSSSASSAHAIDFILFLLFNPADLIGPCLLSGARGHLVGGVDLGAQALGVGGGPLHPVDAAGHDGVVQRGATGSTEQQAAYDERPGGYQAHGFVSVVVCDISVVLVVPGKSVLLKTTLATSGATHIKP